ncbi:MAG: carotenoid 1,2-hydratase [Pseudomonadota bacterium]
MFSPWYKWSGRRDPENHVCVNIGLYGPAARWTMTDRGRTTLSQTAHRINIGPSSVRWDNGALILDVDEMATPHGSRITGRITVTPSAVTGVELPLTAEGTHVWRPFGPTARIDCDLDHGSWRWSGHGYFDANFGTRALEQDFNYWTWSRMPLSEGTACFYDVIDRAGAKTAAGFLFHHNGSAEPIPLPDLQPMRRTLWALPRQMRCDAGQRPRQVKHMLDAPFYCRSGVESWINGERSLGMHEALDLRRFDSRALKYMLAVRVPRRARYQARVNPGQT